MNPALHDIPDRILEFAAGALSQANTHAVFTDPGNEHWDFISITNTAHAGELLLKAIIAKEHPLLIFKDLFLLDDSQSEELDMRRLLQSGRTHDFEKLPQVMWAATGQRVPNMKCFERLRRTRNAIQHFCAPENDDLRGLSLEFIYTIIDPLMFSNFGMVAIEYHEDHSIGYDYVVGCLLRRGLKFTIPQNFNLSEISVMDEMENSPINYQNWVKSELNRIGRLDLLAKN